MVLPGGQLRRRRRRARLLAGGGLDQLREHPLDTLAQYRQHRAVSTCWHVAALAPLTRLAGPRSRVRPLTTCPSRLRRHPRIRSSGPASLCPGKATSLARCRLAVPGSLRSPPTPRPLRASRRGLWRFKKHFPIGKNWGPHALRHSFAYNYFNSSSSIYTYMPNSSRNRLIEIKVLLDTNM